jgi:hypothetical protein
MLLGAVAGYVKMQSDVSNTKSAVDKMENRVEVLYQRALWEERGHAGPPSVHLKEE